MWAPKCSVNFIVNYTDVKVECYLLFANFDIILRYICPLVRNELHELVCMITMELWEGMDGRLRSHTTNYNIIDLLVLSLTSESVDSFSGLSMLLA